MVMNSFSRAYGEHRSRIGTLLVAAAAAVATATSRADVAVSAVCSESRVCVNDAVNVTWEVKQWGGEREVVWVAVHDMILNRMAARFDVFQYGHSADDPSSSSFELAHSAPQSLERLDSVIYCYHDGPYKVPEVEWSSVDGQSIVFNFSEKTNRPSLGNAAALNNAIVVNHGDIEMTAATGAWSSDGTSLTVSHVDSATWQAIVNSISDGTFHAMPRRTLLPVAEVSQGQVSSGTAPEESLRGNLVMRMSSPGSFVVYVYVGDDLQSASEESIDVVVCPEQVVVLDTAGTAPSHYIGPTGRTSSRSAQGDPVALPRSFFSVEGVLAMSGDKWLKVPHSIFPNQRGPVDAGDVPTKTLATAGNHSWSIAFWIYLLEDATGSYRGLFYKGDGGNMGRTPSAWLCPDSNRITLRVSSSLDPDIGTDTVASLQSRAWNHVAFSFRNNTEEVFSATVFVNGEVDVSVEFRDIDVIGNNGPLHIGRDPTNLGPRSLISLVRLWGSPLSPGQANTIFQASRSLFYGDISRAMSSRYSAITAVTSILSRLEVVSSYTGSFLGEEEDARGFASQEMIGDTAYEAATVATALCKAFTERLEMYRVAADAGHTEGRVRYASLLLAGREQLYEDGSSCGREKEPDARMSAQAQWNTGGAAMAVNQLELAVRDGSHRAAFVLATVLLSGLDGTVAYDGALEGHARNQAHRVATTSQLAGVGVGAAVFDQWAGAVDSTLREDRHTETLRIWDVSTTSKAIGLLHFAAAGGNTEAQLALGLRYLDGQGVQLDLETAAWYLGCAADTAHAEYNLVGRQPIIEKQRLTEANEPNVAVGELGEDDSAIQFQIHRAAQGHVPSQVALGDLYYWGARGVSRDQVRSLEYFESAASAGDNTARCAAAGMYLKGEGAEANHTRAVELYEIAAEESHVRALNGLGFEYFYGHVLPRNLTKAYEYFQRAADMKQDADSFFNAGHCLATGSGTDRDLERAAEMFQLGAAWGQISCAYELGIMSAQGTGVERDAAEAAKNLQLVAQVGPWGRGLRAAFDCYLHDDVLCALALYAQAAELGYEVAASNAAFLLDRGKIRIVGGEFRGVVNANREGGGPHTMDHRFPLWADAMSIRFHIIAATKGYVPSFLAIGDAFFDGKGGLPRDSTAACWWYSRASSMGLVRGSYNLGYMHEHGLGVPRDYDQALIYYDRARTSTLDNDMDQRLNGMPIELLVFVAKGRLHLNRASGGRFARFWEHGRHQERQIDTREWIPQWLLSASVVNRAQAFTQWVATLFTLPQMLGLDNHGTGTRHRFGMYRDIPSTVYSLITDDNILLLVLLGLLVWVLLLLRRRHQMRLC